MIICGRSLSFTTLHLIGGTCRLQKKNKKKKKCNQTGNKGARQLWSHVQQVGRVTGCKRGKSGWASEKREKESRAVLELCHTAEQEVLDGNTLPSCEHTILYSASHHMTHVTSITPDSVLRASSFMLKERPFKLAS